MIVYGRLIYCARVKQFRINRKHLNGPLKILVGT